MKGKGKPWWVFICHDNKRKSIKVGTKTAASKVAETIEAKLRLGDYSFGQQTTKTFGDYAKTWIEVTVPATCKHSTLKDYEAILDNHVLPVFKSTPVDAITRGKIKDLLLAKSNEGLSPSTVKHIRSAISGVLNQALDDETIPANHALNLGKIAKDKDKVADINPLTADELNTLLDTVQEHFSSHYPLFLLLARTGLRIGEALALRWDDINFDDRYIDVQRTLVRYRINTPKSGKNRRVRMTPQLTETLRNKLRSIPLKVADDAPQYIFLNRMGNPLDLNNWRRRVFKKALEKAELREIRIHDLRHGYATLRLSNGDNLTDVSNQLGHYSVKLTLDVYTHWLPEVHQNEVDKLDNLGHPPAPYPHPAIKKDLTKVG